MLEILEEFRRVLDTNMINALHRRVTIWGNGYSGRFVKWYAYYYHNILADYVIALDMKTGQSYEEEIYRKTVLDFNYKDINDSIIWCTEPVNSDEKKWFNERGFFEGDNLVDFCSLLGEVKTCANGIQFMVYLEKKYGCDFVGSIETNNFTVSNPHAHAYRCTTQKEIFPILDRCHCIPRADDAIFDFGCGKGAALVAFLDYGFERVGGVEYEPEIFNTCEDNFRKLGLDSENVNLIKGSAEDLCNELDSYNWFYFFQPFDKTIFGNCINSICDSYKRKERKIRIISISPESHNIVTDNGLFRLTCQFSIDMRQRVVDIYESY